MPSRFLKPGLSTSEKFNSVSFEAQSLYVRLLNFVDDFGRFDARPSVIQGICFSVWNDQNPSKHISVSMVSALCQQLADKKLLDIYETKPKTGEIPKRFLQLTNWTERTRSASKWPLPAECQQVAVSLPAECQHVDSLHRLTPSPSPSPSPTPPGAIAPECQIYEAYPRKVGKPKALTAIRKQIQKFGFDLVKAATERFSAAWKGETDLTYCPHPATWFNQERFNDAPETWNTNRNGSGKNGGNRAPENPRNAHTYPTKTNYADAVKRASARMVQQVAEAQNRPSPAPGGNGA